MAQCLKAAMLGREVSSLIDRFDKVSLEDISNLIATALDQAGSITGKDLSEIKLKTNAFFDSIENDQVLKDSVDLMLEELNKAGISTVPSGASSPAAGTAGANPAGATLAAANPTTTSPANDESSEDGVNDNGQ